MVPENDIKPKLLSSGAWTAPHSSLLPAASERAGRARVILPRQPRLHSSLPSPIQSRIYSQHATAMALALLARLTAPPTQTLRILSPTPSTVSFTVSTRPVPATLAAKLRYYVGLLTRLLLGLAALFALWVKWRVSHGLTTDILLYALGGPQTAALLKCVGRMKWSYIGGGAFVVLFAVLRRGYTGMYLLFAMRSYILIVCRRVSDGTARPWCADEFLCGYIPAGAAESVYPYESYPGCVDPRGVSRVRGAVLPCYCGEGGGGYCGGVSASVAAEGDTGRGVARH